MKEVTYEEWQKNPTPRMMWVRDSNESNKKQRKVIYFLENKDDSFPVIALDYDGTITDNYKHCAEIEEPKTRRMTHKELSRWLRENPTREFMDSKGRELIFCHHSYYEDEASKEVPGAFLIRENDGEWREPLVEVKE